MDTTQEPLFDASVPVVRNSVVVNVSGEKIGFVGYVLIETVKYLNLTYSGNLNLNPI